MAAQGTSSSKGNGASKRMSNPRRKSLRGECWRRGEERKARRRAANEALHQERIQNGGLGRRERRRAAHRATP